jgi:hypothetical protein
MMGGMGGMMEEMMMLGGMPGGAIGGMLGAGSGLTQGHHVNNTDAATTSSDGAAEEHARTSTKAVATLVQSLCRKELARFPTPLYVDEEKLTSWHAGTNVGAERSVVAGGVAGGVKDTDAAADANVSGDVGGAGVGVGTGVGAVVTQAERCGLVTRIGIKRVLHAAIEQAWAAATNGNDGSSSVSVGTSVSSTVAGGVKDSEDAVTLAWCQALPKVELHAHLNGSLDASALKALLAHPANATHAPDASMLAKVQIADNDQRTMSQCFELFDVVHKLYVDGFALLCFRIRFALLGVWSQAL